MASEKILLVSESQVKEHSIIESNVDSKTLSRIIHTCQVLQVKPVLGSALYETLLTEVGKTVPSSPTYIPAYALQPVLKEMLDDYIKPYLIFATICDFIVLNNYKLTNKGLMKMTDNSAQATTPTDMEYLKNYYDNYLASHKAKLIQFLKDNDLLVSGTDTNTTSYSIGWFLDDGNVLSASSENPIEDPFEENDPVWLVEKVNYYTKTDADALLALKAALSHVHVIADVTGLQVALDGKAALIHSHAIADVTGLQVSLDSKAALAHSHIIGDVTGLQAALDGKALTVHSHAAADIVSGIIATARLGSGSATASTYLAGDSTWKTIDLSGYLTTSAASTTYVPYTGATTNVNLGVRTLTTTGAVATGALTVTGSISSTGLLGVGTTSPVTYLAGVPMGAAFFNAGGAALSLAASGTNYWVMLHNPASQELRFYNASVGNILVLSTTGVTVTGAGVFSGNVNMAGLTTSGTVNLSGANAFMSINTTNSNLYKMMFKTAGVLASYIGADSGTDRAFAVANSTGVEVFSLSGVAGNATFVGDITTSATKRIYLDGGSNTYITESSADNIAFVTGGANRMNLNSTGFSVTGSGTVSTDLQSKTFYTGGVTGASFPASPSNLVGAGVSIGTTTTYNYIQSWNAATLSLNPMGNDITTGANLAVGSRLKVTTMTEYADNAAALAGGLVIGQFYRTGDLVKVVR